MNTKTGEIRPIMAIEKEVPKNKLGEWSKPFYKGMQVNFSGVRAEIIKIKQAKKQIHLQYKILPRPLYKGMKVNFLNVPMEVIKIKKGRHEIHLQFREPSESTHETVTEIDILQFITGDGDCQLKSY